MSPPRQYAILFARVHFSHHNFYIAFFLNFHAFLRHFCSLAAEFFLKMYNLMAIRPFDSHPAIGALNPLSPKSDQHQISPCNINALSNRVVMRIRDMITQDEFA